MKQPFREPLSIFDGGSFMVTTTEPLTEAEAGALTGFMKTLRPPKPPTPELPSCLPSCADYDDNAEDAACDPACPRWAQLEKERTRWHTGKWTCSTDEENFNCSEHFDTEAEAIEYGKVLSEENGLEDGELYWTGRIAAVTADEMAEGATDGGSIVEHIESYLYDNLGGDITEDGIGATDAQLEDLTKRIQGVTRQWIVDHDLVPNWCRIEKSRSHLFAQCDEVDSTRFDPANHPRCIRYDGHDGEHDFP